MIRVKEVIVEIMRHGDPHNQLLSPMTRYLALCGSHPAETLTIPMEHHQVVHLLQRMIDQPGQQNPYQFEQTELRNLVTNLLSQLPALPNETKTDDDTLVHLRLTITAQELALLPFELARPPKGLSQCNQPLLMGPLPNMLLTREVRRSGRPEVEIPSRFRVLVVAADPNRLGIPLTETLTELVKILRPFGMPGISDESELVPVLDDDLINVLHDASLDEVREKCQNNDYSHVHFLAHGAPLPGKIDAFGITLWDRQKRRAEVVNSDDLARALTPPRSDGSWSQPWCVTLASCDSSRQESIPLVPQSSLAHALHEVGIPTVIASQYPLTFGAAVEMTRALYTGEMQGDDIRITLRTMRHRIGSRMRTTYDWASLAVYAGWPQNMSDQVEELRALRIVQQLEVANNWADRTIQWLDTEKLKETRDQSLKVCAERLESVIPRLKEELKRNQEQRRGASATPTRRRKSHWFNERHLAAMTEAPSKVLLVEFCGLLGSACKRLAHIRHLMSDKGAAEDALQNAADYYGMGAEADQASHWNACQAFVLDGLHLCPDREGRVNDNSLVFQEGLRFWRMALNSAERELNRDDTAAIWAHSSMIEIELWRERFTPDPDQGSVKHAKKLVSLAGNYRFALGATRRQLRRYLEWWGKAEYAPGVDDRMVKRVQSVLEVFPSRSGTEEQLNKAPGGSILPVLDTFSRYNSYDQLGDKVITADLGEVEADADDAFFRVQMLPARSGDALWIEYGREGGKTHRILVDGGYRKTVQSIEQRIRDIAEISAEGKCHFELMVVSHVDTDHIEGIVELLGMNLPISIGDIWFNGRTHLDVPPPTNIDEDDHLAGKHGMFLDTAIALLNIPWNDEFNGDRVVVRDNGAPQEIELDGGMRITLLSPTAAKLADLAPEWDKSVRDAGLEGDSRAEVLEAMEKLHFTTEHYTLRAKKPSGPIDIDTLREKPDTRDPSEANGSSIAFIATFAGRSILFTGDAHADVLLSTIAQLVGQEEDQKLKVGAVKLSHHGSRNNVSTELLNKLDTRTFLVSTNGGSSHYHPDREAIARIVAGGWRESLKEEPVHLLFNYESEYTKVWDDEALKQQYNYETHFPSGGDVLQLSPIPRKP